MDDAKDGGTTADNVKKKIEDMSDDELKSRVMFFRRLLANIGLLTSVGCFVHVGVFFVFKFPKL